jgi:hypothetical protein
MVLVGTDPGVVTVHEQNSCANLQATLECDHSLCRPLQGPLIGGEEVCTGTNLVTLTTTGNRGR